MRATFVTLLETDVKTLILNKFSQHYNYYFAFIKDKFPIAIAGSNMYTIAIIIVTNLLTNTSIYWKVRCARFKEIRKQMVAYASMILIFKKKKIFPKLYLITKSSYYLREECFNVELIKTIKSETYFNLNSKAKCLLFADLQKVGCI